MKIKANNAFLVAALILSFCTTWSGALAQPEIPAKVDRVTGLLIADGWELVQTNCTRCHSPQLIIQNSGNREVWQSRLSWMQETQGLEQFDAEVENSILDYLARNYAQKDPSRRASLEAELMPVNPYAN